MPDSNTDPMERSIKVPKIMYQSFVLLQNPRKLAVFDHLCRAQRKVATKDVEVAFQKEGSGETIGYIATTLRELEEINLAKYVGEDVRTQSREGDWKQTFKCYEATDHGLYIHGLCRSYDSDRPLANIGGTLDPKRVVESFAKLQKDELAFMLKRFRDVYLLGAVLISIHYQKHESATSDWLSRCVDGRLSKDEVEKVLGDYIGKDGLVLATTPERSILDRGIIRLAELLAGRNRVRRWLSNASYSLTPEGKKIVLSLLEEFHPTELGVNDEYLRPEKVEADGGVLVRAIVERVGILGVLVVVPVYSWLDLFRKLNYAPSDTVGIAVDLIMFLVTFVSLIFYGIFRLPGLLTRIVYWRRVRRNEKSTVTTQTSSLLAQQTIFRLK